MPTNLTASATAPGVAEILGGGALVATSTVPALAAAYPWLQPAAAAGLFALTAVVTPSNIYMCVGVGWGWGVTFIPYLVRAELSQEACCNWQMLWHMRPALGKFRGKLQGVCIRVGPLGQVQVPVLRGLQYTPASHAARTTWLLMRRRRAPLQALPAPATPAPATCHINVPLPRCPLATRFTHNAPGPVPKVIPLPGHFMRLVVMQVCGRRTVVYSRIQSKPSE